ncbi:MAG: hypothetical protein Q7J31_11405 [Syntrophales bacterium]|nr:hypothetical protein [Syntrophales bacterium]
MDSESQKRKIRRFLKGSIKDGLDAFCIYQWIERCHYQEWWEMGVALGSQIQLNSLNKDYQKRLEFILKDCRIKQDMLNGRETLVDPIIPRGVTPRHPIRKIIRDPGSPSVPHPSMGELRFDNDAKKTLRQIYSVLYYLGKRYDFVDAVHRTKDMFHVRYQTVDAKCAHSFAGTVDIFQRWYQNGEILQRLRDHFHLSYNDIKIFEKLLSKK